MNPRTIAFACATVALTGALATPTSARSLCDGFHHCRCGVTQARHYNLPLNYKGHNLKQAIEWKRAFPRTAAAPGVVVYQHGGGPTGHVSRIVSLISRCRANVSDDAGQYERNICTRGAVYLDANGNGTITATIFAPIAAY